MKYDVIIIGAGAAGLMAASNLLKAGYRVCLLEAAAAAGGRIATIKESGFSCPVEAGAEFIHGKLPLTLKLLNKANIDYAPLAGKMISVQKGKWHRSVEHNKQWELFIQQLGKLKTDISLGSMLSLYFPGARFTPLRQAVQRYAEGFDLADINKASALAARQEWGHAHDEQYRLTGGYMQLVEFLLSICKAHHAAIYFNTPVKRVAYNTDGVTVYSDDDRQFAASRTIITVSAGILQSNTIEFAPLLDVHYVNAIKQLGFGDVVKVLLQFNHPFWKNKSADIGFVISDEAIPTWWTQLPAENNILTGWLGGSAATAMSGNTEEAIVDTALLSLSGIFQLSTDDLRAQLAHQSIHCWRNHAYIKGGYSYVTTESVRAKKILAHPVENVIFFAGEAIHRGASQGTVEAALQSGKLAAKMIKDLFPSEIIPTD